MATQWTDHPATSNTHIRAVHINELRSAVDCNRSAYGLPGYAWTDVPVSSSIPIRAIHFNEIRTAIQDLWNRKSMGTIPNWSVGSAPSSSRPISARDINDLRGWLNQYENTGGLRGPKRGIHLRNNGDLRTSELQALQMFTPGLAVVLSTDVLRPAMLNYLKSIQNSAEIFIRHVPPNAPHWSYAPIHGSYSLYDPTYRYTYNYDKATQKSPGDVATEIITLANSLKANGLTSFRWVTGNEPEIEWAIDGSVSWWIRFWTDVQHYYRDIYDQLEAQGRPCEIYPPCFHAIRMRSGG
ncbi:MAG: hypothetical protein M1136_08865 [Chloroflexi bacterium]|nr:hypothetical protein [Chloroflexota bacterium]